MIEQKSFESFDLPVSHTTKLNVSYAGYVKWLAYVNQLMLIKCKQTTEVLTYPLH